MPEYTPTQLQLRRRLLEISFQQKLSHLGSCLSIIDVIDTIFAQKKSDELFVLSNGHAGMALYVVLEKLGLLPTEKITELYIHPDRNPNLGIDVSTGSLGQGYPIAAGIALANRSQKTYCTTSDGEWAEGSMWETLSLITDTQLNNLLTIVNANGWSAYRPVATDQLLNKLNGFGSQVEVIDATGPTAGYQPIQEYLAHFTQTTPTKPQILVLKTSVEYLPFLQGQAGHYHVMTEGEYQQAVEILK